MTFPTLLIVYGVGFLSGVCAHMLWQLYTLYKNTKG